MEIQKRDVLGNAEESEVSNGFVWSLEFVKVAACIFRPDVQGKWYTQNYIINWKSEESYLTDEEIFLLKQMVK